MADKEKAEGTHIIEPALDKKQGETSTSVELVNVEWDGKSIQVPKESADAVKESLRTMEGGLKTKHETAMTEAKATQTHSAELLAKDIDWYSKNPQEAWTSYVPLVTDEQGGFKGDPSLLISKVSTDDSFIEPGATQKQTAMKPDSTIQELANLRKEQESIKLQIARGEGQKTLGIIDSVLADSKFNLASRNEVLSEVKDYYYNRTEGQQPSRETIKGFAQASHDSTTERNKKAGYVIDKTRFSGASLSGGMPVKKVASIGGNPFGTQAEKDQYNRELADRMD